MKVEEAKNKRFILSAKALWLRELGEILKEKYRGYYKIRTREFPYCPVKMISMLDPEIKKIMPYWK